MFDINKDGVANYGMYPDWLQELQTLGGRPILTDMFHGAEAYLEMWERAYGVRATSCRPASGRIGARGVGGVGLGQTFESVLYAAGQPASRIGSAYQYCVTSSKHGRVAAVFGPHAKVAAVFSTAPRYRVGSVHPGARAGAVTRGARSIGHGLWLGKRLRDGARYVYGVRGGRVRFAGVASRRAARSVRRLRADVRSAGV